MRAVGVGACVLGLATTARAESTGEAPNSYALAWVRDAEAGSCPAGREFADEVTRRLGHSPFDQRAERAIEIRVEHAGTTFTSHVYVRDRDGLVVGQRVLSSPDDCKALFSATALAVALLIDPERALHADAGATRAVARFEVPEPPAPPAPPEPTTPAPAASRVAGARPRAVDTTPTPTPRGDAGEALAQAAVAAGVVPGVAPGAELFVRKRLGERTGVALSALYLGSGEASVGATTLEVGLTTFGLSAELDLFAASPTFSAGIDVGAKAGALRTSVRIAPESGGTSVVPSDPGDFFFAALDAGLHARIGVASAVVLEARALALLPLVRRSLEVTSAPSFGGTPPNTPVWTQPVLGGLGTLGLGVPFP
jgi:hypothetical protein